MKKTLLALLVLCVVGPVSAQNKLSFVDGFHGGVYGHYPLKTYTDYMADQLESHPGWRICLEIEPETWDSVAVRTPDALKRFQALAATSRVEFTNPAYAQPYMYNVYGESIIRQLTYGMDKIRQYFPDAEFLTYAVEEPCFTSCLPAVLSGLGFKYASLKCPNTCWGGYAAGFGNGNVRWTGPDGSTLLTAPRYACEGLGDTVWETRGNGRYPDYLAACDSAGVERPVGMCYQDAGWTNGPWLGRETGTDPADSPYVTWREYFEGEAPGTAHETYRMSQEDVRPGLVWGSQVLQRLAQQVRQAENRLLMTEKTAALLSLETGRLPDQKRIDEAWRTLMLSQHHDCWIVPYNRLNRKGSWADNVALWTRSSLEHCDAVLADYSAPHSEPTPSYGIVNTAPFGRSGIVRVDIPEGWPERFRIEDAQGRGLPYYTEDGQACLKVSAPALGIAPVKLLRSGKSTAVRAETEYYLPSEDAVKVKTDLYSLSLSPARGGVITSLVTRDGTEYVDPLSGLAVGELLGRFYEEDRSHSSTEHPASVQITRAKGLNTVITVRGTIASVPFKQIITLEEGNPLIGFELEIFWHRNVGIGKFAQKDAYNARHRAFYDTRDHLNVLFPVALKDPALFKDAPFDVCESALEDTFFDRWDEIKHNVILDWVDLCGRDGHSFALLSDHTTAYTYGPGSPLGLSVQFSGNGLWGRNYRIDGPTRMRFAILPHEGRWDEARIQEENLSWNEPLTALPGDHPAASLLDLTGTGYLLSAMTATPEGFLFRLYNASGDDSARTLRLGCRAGSIQEVDLQGQNIGEEFSPDTFTVSVPRHGIKTFKVKVL